MYNALEPATKTANNQEVAYALWNGFFISMPPWLIGLIIIILFFAFWQFCCITLLNDKLKYTNELLKTLIDNQVAIEKNIETKETTNT